MHILMKGRPQYFKRQVMSVPQIFSAAGTAFRRNIPPTKASLNKFHFAAVRAEIVRFQRVDFRRSQYESDKRYACNPLYTNMLSMIVRHSL